MPIFTETHRQRLSFAYIPVKKAILNNSSNKETKITKEKVCNNGIIGKALIYTPPRSKNKSLTREQWLVTHPLQGGRVSPR